MMNTRELLKSIYLLIAMLFMQHAIVGQTVSWGPTIPAVTSEDIHTCFEDGAMSFEFTNAGSAIQNTTIQIQLDTGIFYVPGSFLFNASGNITIIEDDISNLNRPIFSVNTIPSGGQIRMSIDRIADCEAMALRIAGSASIDTVRIYDAGVEVTYTNGISNGTINYEILYGLLSITDVTTAPELINFGSTSTRSMRITNGAFGTIDEFYIADVYSSGELDLSNFRINASGNNYTIPPDNISISGDSVIVAFTPTDITAINGSAATVGDGDSLFEADESFILSYDVTPNICGVSNSISSELIGWFGCSYSERCQVVESAATISLTNATPILEFSNAVRPSLDFCNTVTYSFTITNTTPETSPPGAAYAKDVTAILGLRSNNTPVATLADNRQWGTQRMNTRYFTNHELNGIPITLPMIPGLFGTTIPHIPPDFFTSDPDGPGGLTDVDGDGYYDDLPKDASLHISYGVFLEPRERDCGTGRFDYLTWEHVSADISWFNDCGLLMSPQRQQFNYTNHIRDYLNSTFTNAPTDVVDGQLFEVGIRPHLHSTILCNGGSALNGSSMNWVTQVVLPPGVSMAPGYDMSIYDVNGNVVTTTDKYRYTFTNFPLQFSCADYDDAGQIIIPISTRYVCNDGAGTCFEEEMHCVDLELNPQCLGNCVGVSPLGFTSNRISESWTDDTQSSLVDLSDPSIVTNYVYPFDTVDLYAQGVMNETMADELFLRIRYTPENGGNIFDYQDGTIEIVDIDGQYNGGQTNYSFPLTSPPVVNDLGGDNYEMIFDLSSYRSLINANYSYGQSAAGPPTYDADTVKVSAKVVITNTMQATSPFKVDSLRSEFFLEDGFGDELSCGTWGSELFYEYPVVRPGNSIQNTSGCFGYRKRFFVTHASETGDNFPNEYRPAIHLDSAIINLPVGWDVGDVRWIDNVVMDPSDYELRPDGMLIIRRPSGYVDYDKVTNVFRSFYVDLTTDCRALDGNNNFLYTVYYKEFAYLTDVTSHNSRTGIANFGGLNYTPPTFSIIPVDQSAAAFTETVQWRVRVCNTTSDMDVGFNWLTLENLSNLITVDSVAAVMGSTSTALNTSVLPSGDTYVELGALDLGTCIDLIIYSNSASCERDSLNLSHGWSCSAYPDPSEVVACGAQNELFVLPQFAQVSSTISPLSDTPADPTNPSGANWGDAPIEMCAPFPMELTVVNSQPGNLFDINVNMAIPSAGSGLTYIAGSATIEVEGIDAPNTSRPIGPSAEAALMAASSSNSPNWSVILAELDPSNFGSGSGLPGTSDASMNEFKLRWEMETTCDMTSGDFLNVTIDGNNPCGSRASGSSELIQSYPISIDGAAPPYFSFFTSGITPNSDFEGCSDLKTIDINILLSGGVTGSQDTLEVFLPDGLGYAGDFVCVTPGNCPTYVGTTNSIGGEVLKFNYPEGITGMVEFSFEIDPDNRGACFSTEHILLSNKVSIGGLFCDGGVCPSTRVITGSDLVPISMEKPILNVTYNSLSVYAGNTTNLFYYNVDISNTGLSTDYNVIAEFYCLNASGTDILGGPIARDTLSSFLTTGATANLSGEFQASCDPDRGIGVLIVPEYDNCYCGALESMADKSAGLLEIPSDLLRNIPPYACPTATTNPHLTFRINRSID
jgi:hypothetical protein